MKIHWLLCFSLLPLALNPTPGLSANGIFCESENVVVPCTKLKRAITVGDAKLMYRFDKFVPLWPNQTIFGDLLSAPVTTKESAAKRNAQYNKVVPAPGTEHSILSKPLSTNVFDEGRFVDSHLSTAHGTSTLETSLHSQLVPAKERVFRGEEVFDNWVKAASKGILCRKEQMKNESGFMSRSCAFARLTKAPDLSKIEYCTFLENTDNGPRGAVQCMVVATDKNAVRSVLATQYRLHDVPSGAGGEAEFQCVLPDQTPSDGATNVRTNLEAYLGAGAKILSRPNMEKFEAEGLKINVKDEKVFVRAFLRGRFTSSLNKESYVVMPDDVVKKFPTAPVVAIQTSFTTSAQASDDVTDYREPDPPVGTRISNSFFKAFAAGLRKISPAAVCVTGMI